jgi:hypothetical protein
LKGAYEREKKKSFGSQGLEIRHGSRISWPPEEEAYIEVKPILSEKLRARRGKLNLTQAQLAEKIGSHQISLLWPE